jgi:hypothetical protein
MRAERHIRHVEIAVPAVGAGSLGVLRRLARRLRDGVEQVLFGQAMRSLDPRDVSSYYRTTNG